MISVEENMVFKHLELHVVVHPPFSVYLKVLDIEVPSELILGPWA